MKKLIITALAAALLLVGCAVNDGEETSNITEQPTTEATTPGLYVPSSLVEEESNGAVRLYTLDQPAYHWMTEVGDKIVLASGNDKTVLTILTGEEGVPNYVTLSADISKGGWQVLDSGFAYYDSAEKQAVFLNPQLQELQRIRLPDEIVGEPVFSADGKQVFYCVAQEIRSLDVQYGISRLVKSHGYTDQTLLGCYFDGKILACRAAYDTGESAVFYISCETGETEFVDQGAQNLSTYEDRYFLTRMDGIIQQQIVGSLAETPVQLNTPTVAVPALELGGTVLCNSADQEISFQFIDLTSGLQTSAVTLKGDYETKCVMADRWSGCLWILATQGEEKLPVLLRWEKKATPTQDETVYTGHLYTAAEPDNETLELLREGRVSDMRNTYGVRVRIWDLAVKQPGQYTLKPEYQIEAIEQCLDALEPVLAEFPEKFLQKSVNAQIRVCIVRSVNNKTDTVQYWDGGHAYIAISVGSDVRTEFIKALAKIVDSHVLGNSSRYDFWKDLSPEGFVYGDSSTYDNGYLEGESRAFADQASMASATADRNSIFFHAMQLDNADVFASETMQKKLQLLCRGIRDAWRLKNDPQVFPWEQYLKEPIAPATK